MSVRILSLMLLVWVEDILMEIRASRGTAGGCMDTDAGLRAQMSS